MALFRTSVKSISPGFFRAGTSERYLYVIGLMVDALMQKMVEGQLARMPMKCAPSFLPIIGSDRLINQGLTESVDSYRVRLRRAFEAWQLAGGARGIEAQALGYLLALTPRMRMVSSRYTGNIADLFFVATASNTAPIRIGCAKPLPLTTGDTVTIFAATGNTNANTTTTITLSATDPLHEFALDGTTGNGTYTGGGVLMFATFPTTYPPTLLSSSWDTYEAGQDTSGQPTHVIQASPGVIGANWDWDSVSQVNGSWGFWGAWAILYATSPNNWTDPPEWSWDGTLNATGDDLTWDTIPGSWGLSVTMERVQGLRTVIGQWKPAHAWIRWIIVSFDNALFDPSAPAGGGVNPDGTFGRWSKIVNGQYVASRFGNAEYCDGIL